MQPSDEDAGGRAAPGDMVDFRHGTFHGPVLGEWVQHTHFTAPQSAASWPCQVGTIPPQAACFQARAEPARATPALAGSWLADMHPTAVVSVVTGLGGVGKTQLAAHYARSLWQAGQLDVLVWITASSREAIMDGYTAAAADLIGADPGNLARAVAAFLAWLEPKEGQHPCRWLVVLDDVSDPADLDGLWPPPSLTGRVLVTTRRQDAALTTGCHHIPVGVFTPGESLAYLTHALPPGIPPEQLADLAADLGHLPLALSQAAAYLTDTATPAADYRRLLADRTTRLYEAAPDRLPHGQRTAVAATWALSIDRADRLRPHGLARPLLQLVAFLDANGIPETVLTSAPACMYLARHRSGITASDATNGRPGREMVSEWEVRLTLSALRRLSLIEHVPDTPQTPVRVHQLVQRAVRDTLTPASYAPTARIAADALLAAWPSIEHDAALGKALCANTSALITCAEDAVFQPDAHKVLHRMSRSLGEAGQAAAARDQLHRLATITASRLGPDHPETLGARRNLAYWRGEAGDAARAAAALADLLPDQVRVLGEDHPEIHGTRHDLARMRGIAGDEAGAAAAFTDLLADDVRVLGEAHPHTLGTRHNLAYWRGESGDTDGAAAALADLLPDQVRVLGEDHPQTLRTWRSLARMRGMAGDAAGAAAALADLLPEQVRVLGEDHPEILGTRHDLAYWRGAAGDAAEAVASFADLLADEVRLWGPDHPRALDTRRNLAAWQGRSGDAAGAAAVLADLLADEVRLLGADHPHTLTTRYNQARWRGLAGDVRGAAIACSRLLADEIRVLGGGHPHTLHTLRSLALWHGEAGDAAGAANDLTGVLPAFVRVLGEDHPAVLTTRYNLAHWHGVAGDAAEAAAALAALLDDQARVLGGSHSDTLATDRALVYWRMSAETLTLRGPRRLLVMLLRGLTARPDHRVRTVRTVNGHFVLALRHFP
ncbi:tetratricopeptide repeat protein [Streptomyces cinnabarinus]|uniref:Tetratricopeptide repeat protein n=1 Tax=Streptomyces cinnabarinus TaxID=67287 RepID=A0ABY7K3F6_9ACTN|nr:tetratricopeptide repeat protein [Streptomyces cinnabarinus]WAZ19005.1 tetratricopeptide repeat protein [Streptomyces cinnabarinus]